MNTNTNTPAALLSSAARSAREVLADFPAGSLAALSPFALRDATSSAADALAALSEEARALRDAADAAGRAFALLYSRAPESAEARALRDGAAGLLAALALAEGGARRAGVLARSLAWEWEARGTCRISADAEETQGARETAEALRAAAADAARVLSES